MKNTQVLKVCEKCGKEFYSKSYRAEHARYCSRECWSVRNPPEPKQCEYCGKTFLSRGARFCSRSCSRKPLVGEKSSAWKGGAAAHRTRSKYKGALSEWRKSVYERDNYTCQQCGKHGGDIQAHHIKPLAECPELALDISNGITLCIDCHGKVHGKKFSKPSMYPKNCVDCGAKTSGRSLRCRSCSSKFSYPKDKRHGTTDKDK